MKSYRVGDLTLVTSRSLPGLAPGSRAHVEWRLRIGRRHPEQRFDWYHRAVLPPHNRICQLLGRSRGRHVIRFPDVATFTIDVRSHEIGCHPDRPSLSMATVAHLLVAQVLPLVFSLRRLSLHASAVKIGSAAVGFVGVSGRGKSTVAASLAGRGCPLVTDDCLVIGTRGNSVHVTPVQSGIRLWPDAARSLTGRRQTSARKQRFDASGLQLSFATTRSRLRRLYLLEPVTTGTSTRISAVSGADAVIALLQATSQLDSDRPLMLRRAFERLTTVVRHVDVRRLTFPQRLTALDRLVDTVMADATSE